MPYKLKPNVESFEMVDGQFAGRKFISGEIYTEIPATEKAKFEPVKVDPAEAQPTDNASKRSENQKTEVTDA